MRRRTNELAMAMSALIIGIAALICGIIGLMK